MKLGERISLYSFLLLPLLLLSASFTRAQEVENEREFSYDANSEIGPGRWGEIHPEWEACNAGTMQSPIDLLNKRVEIVSHLGRLQRDYRPANATLVNRGHDMMLSWAGDAGSIKINGTRFHLRQCHWHTPSEHTLNGRRFDMETHLVHESDDGRVAVIGIMYKIGRANPFLSTINSDLEALTHVQDLERVVGVIDPNVIKFGSRKYYRYIGSLTIPPCTQNITWSISRKVRTVTREQVRLIREAVHDDSDANARPLQPLNDRSIELYRPIDRDN